MGKMNLHFPQTIETQWRSTTSIKIAIKEDYVIQVMS